MSAPPWGMPIGRRLASTAKEVSRAFGEALAAAGGSEHVWLILLALKATIGIRVSEEVEESGIDAAEHAETGDNLGEVTMGRA